MVDTCPEQKCFALHALMNIICDIVCHIVYDICTIMHTIGIRPVNFILRNDGSRC